MKTDVTALIERMPAFEARTGIKFHALYAELEELDGSYSIHVRGEAQSGSEQIAASVDIVLGVYDDRGRLVASSNFWLNEETFFAFEAFELVCFDVASAPRQLRLYPKFG